MNLLDSENRINELMSRFIAQIKHSSAMSRIDINKIAETILIPIFAEVYGYKHLNNLNYTEENNYPGIDLGDETARVAFQVTSTSNNEKIKDTLEKFVKNKFYEKYDKLIIYILTEKQGHYTGSGHEEIIQGTFHFDKDKDIRDSQDILKEVANLQIEKTCRIESILEANFGEKRKAPEREVADKVKQIINENIKFFVGRSEEVKTLNEFLSKNSSGVGLLIAGAGFGKTALLANWVNLLQNQDCFIAYHFFSQRYDVTLSVKNAYRHLLQQLYIYYNKLIYQQLPNDEQQLRETLYYLLREHDARKDKPLIIILDSLDEAENPFESPFPIPLPENVFVIVSARAEEGEQPEYLNCWTDSGEPILLNRLPREAIADWLKQAGEGELAIFADDIDFVKQLDEITQGFPLYLKYLTDDLIHIAKQGKDVREVLAQTPKGFEKYVKQQLKRLDELKLPDQRWKFFALLAVAKGTLEKEDVKALTEMRDRHLRQLQQCWQVTRWMKIAENKLYAFAHPLLGKTFANELGDDAEDALEALINYCSRWQNNQSRYALRHYAEHLRDEKQWEDLYAIARNKTFASCQQKNLPDEPDLPLKTIQTALLGAAEEDKAGEMADFILIHAQQVQTTIRESPLEALRKGSLNRALALANMYEIDSCILWYLLLVWNLKEQNRQEEVRKALEQLQNKKNLLPLSSWQGEYSAYLLIYVFEISEEAFFVLQNNILDNCSQLILCKNLSERGYLKTALSVAQSIDIDLDKKAALGQVAIAYAKIGDVTTALNIIDEFKDQKQIWLGKIAIAISLVGNFDKSLEIVQQVDDTVEKAKALGEIANAFAIAENQELSQSIFDNAIKTALSITNQRQQIRVIWEISKSNAKAGNKEAARSSLDKALEITKLIEYQSKFEREYEIGEIANVIALIGDYTKALALIETIENERINSLALVNIVKALAGNRNFALALKIANHISDSVEQARALGKIVKAMVKAGDFNTALNILRQIHNQAEYTWTSVDVVIIMAEAGNFTKALEIAYQIEPDYDAKLRALGKIAMQVVAAGDKEYAMSIFKKSLEIKSAIENLWEWQLRLGKISQSMAGRSVVLSSEIFPNPESKSTITEEDFIPALKKAHQSHEALALIEVAERMALAKLGEQAIKTVMMISINRNFFLPRLASIFAQTGDKKNLKLLLIPCSYYMYAAYQMCGYLAQLYPEKATAIAKVIYRDNQTLG
ncbi:MAG: SMEK domain-containing protein [Nostoc sp. DcaGUA01]|nr:SMEK domain-containing protein [Nostoc sp. DedQUE11]MDZ8078693.1 SMEK domain-containing protein [Nostoc sp. DcaGUA01]